MENTEKLQQKLKSVKRGAYWFGIVGRVFILYAFITLVLLVFTKLYRGDYLVGYQFWTTAASVAGNLITGYLFLLGRDAFEAIEELIREVGEIV